MSGTAFSSEKLFSKFEIFQTDRGIPNSRERLRLNN